MTKLGRVILAALSNGPMHTPGLCVLLDRDYAATVPIVTALRRSGYIEVVGTAGGHGLRDVKASAPVYGLTATGRSIAPEHAQEAQPERPRALRPKGQGKSGQIAGTITIGRGYRWGAGPA